MKNLVILFCDLRKDYMFKKEFSNLSALDLSFEWGKKIPSSEICFLVYGNKSSFDSFESEGFKNLEKFSVPIEILEENTISSFFEKCVLLSEKCNAEKIIFSYADLSFLNSSITEKIILTHEKYKAEYTFFDGFPYGFSPEILDSGTLRILSSLSKTTQSDFGKKEFSRTAIFDFIKLDINSFEIEVETSEEDFGLLRLYFDSSSKLNFLSSLEFYKSMKEKFPEKNASELSENEITQIIKTSPKIYKTVPAYYNIQISSKSNFKSVFEPDKLESEENAFMTREKYSLLLEKISSSSPEAVINPGFFGEALLHPDFLDFAKCVFSYKGFSLLLETDGINVTEELCRSLKEISDSSECENDFALGKITWIVKLDSFSSEKYKELHSGFDGFEKAKSSVPLLEKYFPKKVYPQFIRCKKNEDELEPFFRFWSDKQNGSAGNVLIQKYSSFCGTLPSEKSADLSPIERNACYHLRRDFNVFVDGSVPLCHESLKTKILGNAFSENLEEIFKLSDDEFVSHLKNKYCEMCRKCDEYYTFNF